MPVRSLTYLALAAVLLLAGCMVLPSPPAPPAGGTEVPTASNPAAVVAAVKATAYAEWTALAGTPLPEAAELGCRATATAETEWYATSFPEGTPWQWAATVRPISDEARCRLIASAPRETAARATAAAWQLLWTDTPVPSPTPVPTATPVPTLGPVVLPTDSRRPLRINIGIAPEHLDPQRLAYDEDGGHLKLIYEGLTRLDAQLNAVPAAAERWQYNADATELTFTLRPGLRYADGAPLNALRFAYALLRVADPHLQAPYGSLADDIAGAQEWRRAAFETLSDEDLARLKAGVQVAALDGNGQPCTGYDQPDCLALRLRFRRPAPYFHVVMSLPLAYPARQESIETGPDWWAGPYGQASSNGPYMLAAMERGIHTRFVANPAYWRGQNAWPLEFTYIQDANSALAAYQRDEIDLLALNSLFPYGTPLPQGDPQLMAEARQYPGACTTALLFNSARPPFDDRNVRAAFALALDREAWARDVHTGTVLPAQGWIPPGMPGYRPGDDRWGFDPGAARRALAASRYGGAQGLPQITLAYSDTPRGTRRHQWLAAQWHAVLGVDVVLEPCPTGFCPLNKIASFDWFASLETWCPDIPDPYGWLTQYWRTDGYANRERQISRGCTVLKGPFTALADAGFDALVDQAGAEPDPARRAQLFAAAQDALVDAVPAAFLSHTANRCLVKPWVHGLAATALDADWCGSLDPLTIAGP